MFLEETIGSLDAEADSGVSTDETDYMEPSKLPGTQPKRDPLPQGELATGAPALFAKGLSGQAAFPGQGGSMAPVSCMGGAKAAWFCHSGERWLDAAIWGGQQLRFLVRGSCWQIASEGSSAAGQSIFAGALNRLTQTNKAPCSTCALTNPKYPLA